MRFWSVCPWLIAAPLLLLRLLLRPPAYVVIKYHHAYIRTCILMSGISANKGPGRCRAGSGFGTSSCCTQHCQPSGPARRLDTFENHYNSHVRFGNMFYSGGSSQHRHVRRCSGPARPEHWRIFGTKAFGLRGNVLIGRRPLHVQPHQRTLIHSVSTRCSALGLPSLLLQPRLVAFVFPCWTLDHPHNPV